MKKANPTNPEELRRKAKEVIQQKKKNDDSDQSPSVFLNFEQELSIHQLELEMQNEELRKLSDQLSASNEKYLHLYEKAPVGYLTLSNYYNIKEINCIGALLFGEVKERLINRNLMIFIHEGNRKKLKTSLELVKKSKSLESCELKLNRSDGLLKYIQVESKITEDEREYMLALIDITSKKMTEFELNMKNQAIASSVTAIVLTNLEGNLTYANPAFLKLWGFSSDKNLKGRSIYQLWNKIDSIEDIFDTSISEGSWHQEIIAKTRAAMKKNMYLTSNVVFDEENVPTSLMFSILDMSELRKIESDLKISEENYAYLSEFTANVIAILNVTKDRFTYLSPSITRLRGVSVEEALDETLEDILEPESYLRIKNELDKKIIEFIQFPDQPLNFTLEAKTICKDKSVIWIEASGKLRYNKDDEIEAMFIVHNIDERKNTEKELQYISYHDRLTGLYNRRFYEEQLLQIDTAKNYPIAMIMVDVNGLKLVNDAFGHLAGDNILIRVSDILKANCGDNGFAARIGGDEFILLMTKTDETKVKEIISNIYAKIDADKNSLCVLSASAGYALKTTSLDNIFNVFKRAEDDLYTHKMSESLSMRSKTISLIMSSLREKSKREKLHSDRVGEICAAIAAAMNLSTDEINQSKLSGLMHDIGKIGINDNILNKVGKLNQDEWVEMKRHSEIGFRILSSVNEFATIAVSVLEHHERWDGTGYPKKLKGKEISPMARIIAVADSFEAMTAERTYHETIKRDELIGEFEKNSGTLYDPEIVRLFLDKVLPKIRGFEN